MARPHSCAVPLVAAHGSAQIIVQRISYIIRAVEVDHYISFRSSHRNKKVRRPSTRGTAQECGRATRHSQVRRPDMVLSIVTGGLYVGNGMFAGTPHLSTILRRPTTSLKTRLARLQSRFRIGEDCSTQALHHRPAASGRRTVAVARRQTHYVAIGAETPRFTSAPGGIAPCARACLHAT